MYYLLTFHLYLKDDGGRNGGSRAGVYSRAVLCGRESNIIEYPFLIVRVIMRMGKSYAYLLFLLR